MSISISSRAPSPMVRMQSTLAAVKAAEEAKAKTQPKANVDAAQSSGSAPVPKDDRNSAFPRRSASSDGPRVEVDRRTEDSGSMQVTVVSYSDGSSDSITQMKADGLVAQITDQISRQVEGPAAGQKTATSLSDKGLLVDVRA